MKINPLDLESQSDIYQSDQALGMELSWMQMKLCIKMSDYKSLLVLTSSHISPSGACVARLAFLEVKTGSKQRKQAKLTSLTGTWNTLLLPTASPTPRRRRRRPYLLPSNCRNLV